ncbi:MAG: PAS domain-containing protein, partial [Actinomycetota bacterium]
MTSVGWTTTDVVRAGLPGPTAADQVRPTRWEMYSCACDCGFREALDAMRDLVLIKGPESRLLWANAAFRELYGMTEEELRDLIDGPQADPDDTMQYVRDDRTVFATADHLDIPAEQVTDAAGVADSFHTVKSPIIEDGEVVRSVGVSRRHADTEISSRRLSHDDAKALARPLRLLTSSFPLAIALVDVGGRVITTSPQWRETFGSHAVSLDDHLLRSLPSLADLTPVMADALQDGRSGILQVEQPVDGEVRILDLRVGPWHYDDGSVGGAMVLAIDVTDEANRQRELEVANERYDLVLGGSSVGIWDRPAIDDDREYWSNRFYELLGYEPGEVPASGSMFFDLLHPEDRVPVEQLRAEHLANGATMEGEYRLRHKSGEYRWFWATGKAATDRTGRPTRMVGSIQDIDARMQAEQRVRRVNEALEHFVHVAAHDLREPT